MAGPNLQFSDFFLILDPLDRLGALRTLPNSPGMSRAPSAELVGRRARLRGQWSSESIGGDEWPDRDLHVGTTPGTFRWH